MDMNTLNLGQNDTELGRMIHDLHCKKAEADRRVD